MHHDDFQRASSRRDRQDANGAGTIAILGLIIIDGLLGLILPGCGPPT